MGGAIEVTKNFWIIQILRLMFGELMFNELTFSDSFTP